MDERSLHHMETRNLPTTRSKQGFTATWDTWEVLPSWSTTLHNLDDSVLWLGKRPAEGRRRPAWKVTVAVPLPMEGGKIISNDELSTSTQ